MDRIFRRCVRNQINVVGVTSDLDTGARRLLPLLRWRVLSPRKPRSRIAGAESDAHPQARKQNAGPNCSLVPVLARHGPLRWLGAHYLVSNPVTVRNARHNASDARTLRLSSLDLREN